MRRAWSASIVTCVLALACSSDPASEGAKDAGSEAVVDAPAEHPTEASADAPGDESACKLIGPYSSSNPSCNACAEAKCCAEVNACFGDPDCNDGYVNCILACALGPEDAGDAAVGLCLGDCASQFPKGKLEYDAAIACAEAKCTVCQ